MKYLALLVSSLVLTACNGGGDDAIVFHINAANSTHIAAATDSVTIVSAKHSGAGCPSGTGEVVLSEDKKTVSVLFEEYQAEAGVGTGPAGGPALTTNRVACNIAVSLHIPSGYQAFLIGADFRGAVSLPDNAYAEFNREYFFAAERSPVLTATWSNEVDNEDIEISDDLYVDAHTHSVCGEDVILRNNTSLYVSAPADADTALIQIDSLDQQNKARFDYQLDYAKCT